VLALAKLQSKSGRPGVAAENLERALELAPDNYEAREGLADLYASPHYAEDEERRRRAGALFVELGQSHLKSGGTDAAINYLRRALGIDPLSRAATNALERALAKAGRFDEVDRLYRHRSDLTNSDAERIELLTKRLELCRQHLESREELKTVLAELATLHPPRNEYANELRQLYHEDENWDELVALIEREGEGLADDVPALIQELLELATIEREYRRNRDRAAELVHRVLQLDPTHAEAMARYVDHFRERRDWRGLADLTEFSIEQEREAGAATPHLVRRLEELAQVCELRLGDVERAMEVWQRISTLEPSSPKATEALRRLGSRAKRWQSLVSVLQEQADQAQSPEAKAEALHRIARTYREQQVKPRHAINLFEQVLELFPNDNRSLKALLELYEREGDDAGLAHTLRRQLDVDDQKLRAGGQDGSAVRDLPVAKRVERLNALRRLATMYEDRLADVDGVVYACSGILELLPGDRDALGRMERVLEKAGDWARLEQTLEYHVASAGGPAERAKVLRRLARLAAKRDDQATAMERWENVVRSAPNDSEALQALSALYTKYERWGELAQILERVLLVRDPVEPGSPEAVQRANDVRQYAKVVDQQLGDRNRGIKAWRMMLTLLPRDRDALDALSRLFEESGQWRELADILSQQVPLYVREEPEKAAALALQHAGLLEDRLGAPNDACDALEHLIRQIDPGNLAAHKALRRLYEGRGDIEQAVRIAEREMYLAEDPQQKVARGLEIGFLCRDRLDDATRSLQAFERVLAIEPTHTEALQACSDLYAQVGHWAEHVATLEKQLEHLESVREQRSLLLRIAQATAERLGDHHGSFLWYRAAHERAPDAVTATELRRAAESYGLWRELLEVYENERSELVNEAGAVRQVAPYLDKCREIAAIAEHRLGDAARAMQAFVDALSVQPRNQALLSEAERLAETADTKDIWNQFLDCLSLSLDQVPTSVRAALHAQRARIIEERLGDSDAAMDELLLAFAWTPDQEESQRAVIELAERSGAWEQAVAVRSALFLRAPTLERRIQCLRDKAELVEDKLKQSVRAFRIHLSAFLLAPEDQETLTNLWRLARLIGKYEGADKTPADEPPPAYVEAEVDAAPAPAPKKRSKRKPVKKPRGDATVELNISDLILADRAEEDDEEAQEEADLADTVDTDVDETAAEPARKAKRGDPTMPLDIKDLIGMKDMQDLARKAGKHKNDPTIQLRVDDLIEALGAKSLANPPPAPGLTRPVLDGKGPPPPPPPIPRIRRRTSVPAAVAAKPKKRRRAPVLPKRSYETPWEELSTAYETLATSSPAMKLRWLFRAAEVQETGAGDIDRAFDILASALAIAPEQGEARDRLYRLAEDHDAWDKLAALYDDAADRANTAEDAASFLLEVAEIRRRQGRPQETESLFRRVLGMRPDDEQARESLEKLYRDEGRWVDLAASLEERTDPRLGSAAPPAERPALLRELARVYEENLARPHDAIEALDRLIKLTPDDIDVLERLVELNRGIGRWSAVVAGLVRVRDVADGTNKAREALRQIGEVYEHQLELHERAAEAYSQLVGQWPDDVAALESLDALYTNLGRWQELSDVLRKRAAIARDSDVRADLLGRRAEIILEWLDAPDEAAAALRHARTIRPDDEKLAENLVTALIKASREREAAAILEGRIASLKESDTASPGHLAGLLIRLASLRHEVLQDREGAHLVLNEAMELVPNHPTALAALAKMAKAERDPAAYAQALLDEAEVQTDIDTKVEKLLEAGVTLRDQCHDIDAARGAFEAILAIRPYHSDATWALAGLVERGGDLDSAARLLTKRLEDEALDDEEKAALFTQLAALSRQAGVDSAAEHNLNRALGVLATHLPAIFAKADLLFENKQHSQLHEFLIQVVPTLEDADAGVRAELRRRLALVHEALGEGDQAYQILIEADRISRNNLLVKLALGENRYRARRWREAALHLGSLADHENAGRHPAEVAEGLFHAALAEIRSLRPEKAGPLYQRAIDLKPNYTPALHALAELAMEQGDTLRAADLLTRQATATTDPVERMRLFEALGDMATMTLGDEHRARVCYEAAVNSADPLEEKHLPLLKKLLELQDLGSDHRGAARTAELMASFSETKSAQAARLSAAADNYLAAGDRERALGAANRAVDADPYDLMAVTIASKLCMDAQLFDDAAAMLGRALSGPERTDPHAAPRESLLWNRLAEARLHRGDRRGAITALEKSVAIAPDSDGAMLSRRQLLELWKDDDDTKSKLIEYHRTLAVDGKELGDIVAYARSLCASRNFDGGRAMLDLASALGHELSEDDWVFIKAQPVRVMAPDEGYDNTLSARLRDKVLHDPDVRLMSRLQTTLWEAAPLLWSNLDESFARLGIEGAERVGATTDYKAAAIFTRVAKALGTPANLVYKTYAEDAPPVQVVCASPPVIVLGPGVLNETDEENLDLLRRFLLGRAAELARPENIVAAGMPRDDFVELMASLTRIFADTSEEVDEDTAAADEALRTNLPVRLRSRLKELFEKARGLDLDPDTYADAIHRMADRAGLLVCGDAKTALAQLDAERSAEGARDLVALTLTPEYLDARRALGVGVLK
jgi:tetratricopeptide (TPR) repeat protein